VQEHMPELAEQIKAVAARYPGIIKSVEVEL